MENIAALLKTVAHLRSPQGCPWDREQTHESLQRCLIEESAEVLQAIDHRDDQWLCEELGDLLLQVVLHSQIASERGAFDFDKVVKNLKDKLVRRHPHVFSESPVDSAADAHARWNAIKAEEKKAKGIDPEAEAVPLPPALPALTYAAAVCRRLKKDPETWLELSATIKENKDFFELMDTKEDITMILFLASVHAMQQGWDLESQLRSFMGELID